MGLMVLSLAFGCGGPKEGVTPETGKYWPTEGWRTSAPEEQGMDPAKLGQMMDYISENNLAIDSVVVVRNGYIVFEEYPNPVYDKDMPHIIHSITKSFVSSLLGIAIREGLIEGVDQKFVDLFPERTIQNLDSRKESITLENVLTMSVGMEWNEWKYAYTDARNDYIKAVYYSSDPVQYVLDLPMMEDPGVRWNYNGGTSHLLSALVSEVTGYDTLEYAKKFLFAPLGITQSRWDADRHGIRYGGGGLYLTPRDMAKFGYLYLNNGMWEGEQIVPADFVAKATKTHFAVDAYTGYGYQSWWICRDTGVYYAAGLYGQRIYVDHELDLVVVFTANIKGPDPESQMRHMVYEFIRGACD
jgi:CubicO group peptidase (beta-lactamase class C family)